MAIQQKLHTKLVQKLILTPSLQQAIKLLPMSTLELAELLNQEMVENPLLEEVPTEELQPAEQAAAADKTDAEKPDGREDRTSGTTPTTSTSSATTSTTATGRARRPKSRSCRRSRTRSRPPARCPITCSGSCPCRPSDEHGSARSARRSSATSTTTAIWSRRSRRSRRWATGRSPTSRRALQHVQTFDPIGVAARDLQECLWLQLRHLGLEGTPTEKIVTEHLRLLQNHQVPEIARRLGMTIEDLKEHIEIIRNLDPKPGSRYNPPQSQYVIPDVYVVKVEDQYVAMLNEDGLPQLRISPVYRRLLDKNGAGTPENDETRAYVKDKFRSALWLIKSVDQRQKTIHKVATSIINFQREFLDHGIEHLRPLVLRDVANDIGMHESTVSRVVNNKYMHTPQGVFELKYFFHSGISSSYGESVSSVTIKQRIRKIIENEDPRKPLSDSKIVSILQKEGLMLARRTIAKYREELKIPTSNQRKVLFY